MVINPKRIRAVIHNVLIFGFIVFGTSAVSAIGRGDVHTTARTVYEVVLDYIPGCIDK